MQTVLDGARKVPFKARADFITRHSIVLMTDLEVAELVNDTVLLRSDYDIVSVKVSPPLPAWK